MSPFDVVTPPTKEPLTLSDVRIHLRQGADGESPGSDSPNLYEALPDDSWMLAKITAARESAEQFLGYPLTDAVYRITFQNFAPPCLGYRSGWGRPTEGFVLPMGVADVVSVQYLDPENVLRTVAPSTLDFDPVTRRIYADAWPALSSRDQAVRILVRGLYGLDTSPPIRMPESIKHAMLLMIGEWNENRILSIEGKFGELPLGVEYLLRPLRMRLGMA